MPNGHTNRRWVVCYNVCEQSVSVFLKISTIAVITMCSIRQKSRNLKKMKRLSWEFEYSKYSKYWVFEAYLRCFNVSLWKYVIKNWKFNSYAKETEMRNESFILNCELVITAWRYASAVCVAIILTVCPPRLSHAYSVSNVA